MDNPMAFPVWVNDKEYANGGYVHGGMSLRDYFAAAALTGFLANSFSDGVGKPLSHATALEMAELAYHQADEMLKERAK